MRIDLKLLAVLLLVLLVAMAGRPLTACTTGVISGKATLDGRPLLWKNRDAPKKDNRVVQISDGRYRCTAVVNAGGSVRSIWMGVNEAGFCIENSVTRDLSEKGAKGLGNGGFMLRALKTCATVEQFEQLLRDTDGKRSTAANFGVIDAAGGAAIFESSPSGYTKFDANDPKAAPHGYVVRSNWSYTGSPDVDPSEPEQVAELYSGGRYLRGCKLIDMAIADGGVSVAYMLQHSARDYADARGNPLPGSINGDLGDLPALIDTGATINRRTTVSAAIFQGVKPGEDPRLTTMWVMLGEPSFTVAVPCWATTGKVADALLGKKTSPLNDAARALRDASYVKVTKGEDDDQDDKQVAMLDTSILPDVWQRTLPLERENFKRTEAALQRWRSDGFSAAQAASLHEQLADEALRELSSLADTLVGQTAGAP